MPKLTKLSVIMEEELLTIEKLAHQSGLAVRTIWNAKECKSISTVTARAICKAIGRKFEEVK